MELRSAGWLCAVMLAVLAAAGACPVEAAPAADEPLATEDLIYEGTRVEMQVDVNGAAAMELLGDVLDAAAEAVEEQAAAAEAGESQLPVPPQMLAARPLIGPAKEVLKSVTRASLVVMHPQEGQIPVESVDYYAEMIGARGWQSLARLRTGSGENIAAFLAPGGKGIFAALRPNSRELIVVMLTTQEPLGHLLGQIVRAAGGDVLPQFLAAKSRPQPPEAEVIESPVPEEAEEPEEPAEE